MNNSTNIIVQDLMTTYPDQTEFRKGAIVDASKKLGYPMKSVYPLIDGANRVRVGTYNLETFISPLKSQIQTSPEAIPKLAAAMQSIVNDERSYAKVDPTFVPWGAFNDIVKIIKSEMFYPVYISGLSGNGKTFMVEQAAAKLGRQFIRVQINPETDEDDLLGGFRLIDGETVFSKGPVLKAMEDGAILLLDEIDRATNKIMCLQGILEGKPVLVKKTGETITPSPGFNVIATANTKGKGSEDGRFTAATIIDDAFLERFTVAVDQQFPSVSVEKKIVINHMKKFEIMDTEFAQNLVNWADIIRKTFYDDGVDEVISTRRLSHIVQTFSIFKDKMKSIDLCIARFDEDTKSAFLDLYTKVDQGVVLADSTNETTQEASYE
tara:strand:- start:10806 stop:11945 length:1140 start_codon:yes stop_codon:yes gene_type:complete